MGSLISNPSLCGFRCAPREGRLLSLTAARPSSSLLWQLDGQGYSFDRGSPT